MAEQRTWGTFTAVAAQRSAARQPQLIVNNTEKEKITRQIKKLQGQRDNLYNNDNLSDYELLELIKPIDEKINQLINSMYGCGCDKAADQGR